MLVFIVFALLIGKGNKKCKTDDAERAKKANFIYIFPSREEEKPA